jgi:3-dehydrosphinganine reductase
VDCAGSVVLVTGGSSGIGLAIAKELAARSAFVCLAARREDLLQTALAALPVKEQGGKLAFSVDVRHPEEVAQLIDKVTRQAGVPDIVINSAGVAHPGYVQELDLEIFKWMMDVNYYGTLHVVKAVLPAMLKRGSGYIVNIGSLASRIGVFGYTAYSASKFAVAGFTDVLRMELKPHGINVSIVLPNDTDTPQLAYENRHKPAELKNLLPEMGVVPVELAARNILKGMERSHYEIYPDLGGRLLVTASRWGGAGTYAVLDYLLKRSKSKIGLQTKSA